jgi:magnesium-transporting ATPase (P-type)
MEPDRQTSSEQSSYAAVLHWSTISGFVVLIVTFVAYVLGWLPASVPLEQLPNLWSLSAAEYLKATGTPTGWSWIFMLNKGDFASQLGIAILSGCSVACIAAIMPIYAKTRNAAYIVICTLEIAVLLLSASGVFSSH